MTPKFYILRYHDGTYLSVNNGRTLEAKYARQFPSYWHAEAIHRDDTTGFQVIEVYEE